jgi:hypothetical protein
MSVTEAFPIDPVATEEDLAIVFSNASQFQLFDVPR